MRRRGEPTKHKHQCRISSAVMSSQHRDIHADKAQTRSPKPMKTPARSSSLKTTFIFESSVSADRSNPGRLANACSERNGRKTLTTVQGLPKKFDQQKILKVIKKKFACNGTIVSDEALGQVIQLQGDQRKVVQEFLTDKKDGLGLDATSVKVHGF